MPDEKRKLCFVLMPFEKGLKAVYQLAIKPACEKAGFKALRADELIGPYNIHRDIIKHIFVSDVIIADLTGWNPNVFYEMGVAHVLDNKTIMIIQEGNKLPFDIGNYRCLFYDQSEQGLESLSHRLVEYLQTMEQWRRHPTNPVQDFKPHDAFIPQKKLDEIREELNKKDALLRNSVPKSNLEALQKTLQEKEKLLAQTIPKSRFETLEKELAKKQTEISVLQAQVRQKEELIAQTISKADWDALQQELRQKEKLLAPSVPKSSLETLQKEMAQKQAEILNVAATSTKEVADDDKAPSPRWKLLARLRDRGEKPARPLLVIPGKAPEKTLEPAPEPVSAEEPPPPTAGNYIFPPLDLLTFPTKIDSVQTREELLNNAHMLEERLAEFDAKGNIIEISPGPIVTRYEYEPELGIKVSRITALAEDLALAMRARRIRIVAPIPGKTAVGIELPNSEPQTIYLRKIIDSDAFRQSASPLTIALSETISGQAFVTSLDRMPHLLVADATGSGKSVCLNAIIASMLYKAHPSQVDFVLVDPKRLELSTYRKLRFHHLTFREDLDEEVVTTPANALAVLRSLEWEMENRYSLLARVGVRNIGEYNTRLREGKLPEQEGMPPGRASEPLKPLPYTVLIIDELADLMLTAAKEVEESIARLTQMSRAVGIHLIVATQRPSVDVITGIIKANFPARLAFQVASKIDSRTILDMNGAEKLLGNGDLLFLPPGSPEPIRIHGAFISS